ncbi:hypothetical protein QE430_002464 [Microbacterium testaceum]|uniref:hypothetical protein n=1 Tax=Microbacterium testaceum TaxID=2033 RepID=UPI00278A9DC3|nr:hypothetical protein [Microbacterium testaceum]MDQ1174157.1 hypothetical protein [Microbacterium testaceum]
MRIPRLNGSRGAALLVAGAYCFARGVAYLPIVGNVPTSLPAGLELISAVISIEVWAGIWMIVGIGCVLRAFSTADAIAWGLLTAIMTAWGAAYGLGWLIAVAGGQPSREWLNMSTYLGPAIIIAILSIPRARKVPANAP